MAPDTATVDAPKRSNVEDTKARAELGKEHLKTQKAQGEPGQKQPEHKDTRVSAEDTVKMLNDMIEKTAAPTKESSAKRSQSGGAGNNPIPPAERKEIGPAAAPAATTAASTAAHMISAARDQLTSQLDADAKLTSDLRYERDQALYELQQQGKAGLIPPSEAEVAAAAVRAGTPPEVAEKIPATQEEQISDDMKRIKEAEERARTAATATQAAQTSKPEEKKT